MEKAVAKLTVERARAVLHILVRMLAYHALTDPMKSTEVQTLGAL